MSEALQIAQLVITFLLVPALGYIIKLEKRIAQLETKIEIMYMHMEKRKGVRE